MIWVFAVVVIGLIAVLAELLLSYQKRAHELRATQDPVRRRIRAHAKAMQEVVGGIQNVATEQIAVFTTELQSLAKRADELREVLLNLERKIMGDSGAAAAKDDLIQDVDPAAGKIDAEETPEDKVHKARELLQLEVDGHRLSLQRDVEVVRRTLTLLESKLRRAPAVNAEDKKN